ncbi:MAG: hypothetical protein H7Y86_01425 [Rhizobacter sp.]|nr:hypothetical protein [Ferruginibacter sp.]
MKKIFFGVVLLSSLFVSCSKDGDEGATTPSETYLHTTAGSSWNYRTVDNNTPGTPEDYTRTSTNKDTTINGKTYHVYSNSNSGESEYNGKVGNDYFIFQALPDELGGSTEENLYLKAGAAVNASWTQPYSLDAGGFPVTANVINKIIEKGMTKTVNGVNYTNVIRVKTDISIAGLPPGIVTFTTDINQYYAPKVGLIEASTKITFDVMGTRDSTNETTTLQSATLL